MIIREFILRAHVWMAASLMPLLVRLLPLKRLLRLLTPPGWFRPYEGISPDRIAAIVGRRLRRPRNMRRRACLRRGLLLFHILRLANVAALLHIGVFPPSPGANRMHAHCWVSVDGRCVSDPPEEAMAVSLVYGRQEGIFAKRAD